MTERSRVVLVRSTRIVYLKAELKYITIRTVERGILLEESLTKLEEECGSKLVRVHRNCLGRARRSAASSGAWRDEGERALGVL